jgi:deoxyribodipyrimidine photo-lyase
MAKLIWFRNDLRTIDHQILSELVNEEIIPFYCFDDFYYQQLGLGFSKTSSFRAQFILESVAALKEALQALGADLYVCKGQTQEEIAKLSKITTIDEIHYFQGFTHEEDEIDEQIEKLGIPTKAYYEPLLYHIDDLPFGQDKVPFVFTEYRKKVEKFVQVRSAYPKPDQLKIPKLDDWGILPILSDLGLEILPIDSRAVLPFKGGEAEAWRRLDQYFWQKDLLKVYKDTRNGMLGADYSSKFSVWLSQGCISPVSIYWEVKRYEEQRVANQSTYWLIFELIWCDFFKVTAWAEGDSFFKVPFHFKPKTFKNFEKWRLVATGNDYVDANMKELLLTGFMSNRGRQNVASFLVHYLKEHWYAGAQWFESQLIDYDVCSNYGNWTYVAGQGHDPRNRVFNMDRQADMYDPKSEYRNYWLR